MYDLLVFVLISLSLMTACVWHSILSSSSVAVPHCQVKRLLCQQENRIVQCTRCIYANLQWCVFSDTCLEWMTLCGSLTDSSSLTKVVAFWQCHFTERHLPSCLENFDLLKSKGVDEIICMAVNDRSVSSFNNPLSISTFSNSLVSSIQVCDARLVSSIRCKW